MVSTEGSQCFIGNSTPQTIDIRESFAQSYFTLQINSNQERIKLFSPALMTSIHEKNILIIIATILQLTFHKELNLFKAEYLNATDFKLST